MPSLSRPSVFPPTDFASQHLASEQANAWIARHHGLELISRANACFSRLPEDRREEMVAEVVARAVAWAFSAARRGRLDRLTAYWVVTFAVRQLRMGRDNGSKIRVFNLLKHLSRRHSISLLSFTDGETTKARLQGMASLCRHISTVQYNAFAPTRLKALLGFFSSSPRSIVDTFSHELQNLVKSQVSNEVFDVIVASQLETAPYALLADGLPRVMEEVELGVIYEQFAKQRSLPYKVRYGMTWWKWSRFLARLVSKFEGCTVVSEPLGETTDDVQTVLVYVH